MTTATSRAVIRVRRVLVAAAVLLTASVIGSVAFVLWPIAANDLVPASQSGVVITDRVGTVLRSTRASDGSRYRWVSLASMEPALLAAFVAAEDRSFYTHRGIEPLAVLRAARDNVLEGRVVSGASTITMQTARLIAGLPRGWSGKPRQFLWALRLERHLSKDEILEQYLNRVPLGQGAVGVESAAQLYFGASASHVSLGQAALLAGIARAPSRDNPLVSEMRARNRRAAALKRLAARQFANADDIARADSEPVRLLQANIATAPRTLNAPFAAPHFTSWLLGREDSVSLTGPLRTTLDFALQSQVEGEVRHAVQQLAEQSVQHAAAVVLDNATGDVLAWVGSPDFNAARGQVDMVISHRQPGSALKPFVYALAFDRGVTAATVLDDISRSWQTTSGVYRPRNYDRREHGPVRAREALASSFNIPAVVLADQLGVPAVLHTLRNAGFASLTRSAEHYGLGLALGSGDVSLLELSNAYRAFTNGGVWRPIRVDANASPSDSSVRVVSAGAAALVLDVLSDPVARLAGFGEATPFDFAFPVAVKTGTSRHFTDNWAVAVTGNFTVAVWVGNFDGTPMAAVSGISGAGPLLRRIVLRTAAQITPGVLPSLEALGATRTRVCRVSGQRAVPECPAIDEWFLPGTTPPAGQSWYREGALVLPGRYAAWRARSGGVVGDGERVSATGAQADASTETVELAIESPRHGDRFAVPDGAEAAYATVALRASGKRAAEKLTWSIDGQPFRASRWRLTRGEHIVSVRAPGGVTAVATVMVQ
ncbi:MAG: penicillin-binding protein 1C [Gemmatimonadaceae bacterium]|nr:penicillin-binding protein 1C [Gemmatimonadaceae bacterium]